MFGNSAAEVEAIANRKMMEALLSLSIARSEQDSKALLDASRMIRERAVSLERQAKKHKISWLAGKVKSWLRIDGNARIDDLRNISNRIKAVGDQVATRNDRYHVALCEMYARELDDQAKQHGMKDLAAAGDSIRQMSARFSKGLVDSNAEKKDNNE